MSIHINSKKDEIAETVLMPGDPKRAKWIAENFLNNAELVNTVRGNHGYTGITPQGERITIQASNMGMPTLSIYAEELITKYGVKCLMRLGSCGALNAETKLRQIFLAISSGSDSALNFKHFGLTTYAPTANFELLLQAYQAAKKLGISVEVGTNFATDDFYDLTDQWKVFAEFGVKTIEMESAALYTIAARYKIQALSINTVSDNLVTGEKLSSDEREKTFTDMVKIALAM